MRSRCPKETQGFTPILGFEHRSTGRFQDPPEYLPAVAMVLDNQHSNAAVFRRGLHIDNVAAIWEGCQGPRPMVMSPWGPGPGDSVGAPLLPQLNPGGDALQPSKN
jgi:hypothetical protein